MSPSTYPLTTFIGAGNMASSMIAGLLAAGVPRDRIRASAPSESSRERLRSNYQIEVFSENSLAASSAEVIVLAVKPQVMRLVCEDLVQHLPSGVLVVSIAAGVTCSALRVWSDDPCLAIVRCMPNTPSALGYGASGAFATSNVSSAQREIAQWLMALVGETVWLDEERLMDPVTALSGSGPAYFFLLMEAMIAAGQKMGLSYSAAERLCIQTALGSAVMARESNLNVSELRKQVTSKKGTTEAALGVLLSSGFRETIERALGAAADRSKELASEMSN